MLPLFVLVAAVLMILVIVFRSGERGLVEEGETFERARNGLLSANSDAPFDPAFAVLSPIEMVLAPTAVAFDFPAGSGHGAFTYNAQPFLVNRHLGDDFNGIGGKNSDLGDPVNAVADGKVIYSGWSGEGWGNVVILLHELASGEMVQSLYGHLDSVRVAVGGQVRRGESIGSIGDAGGRYLAHLHFELRNSPILEVGSGYADGGSGRLSGELMLAKWRGRDPDRLSTPPAGEPISVSPLNVDSGIGTEGAP